ncbi:MULTISPECIES: hypothetical protein [Vibrio]|uniref:hypothetical protein n=1 Tax=Vibrio TaxID=662 RepID=UPI00078CBED9|nr:MULTISPECIES: hypothetical protein [Vibrio]BAU70763.1 hypothetical protein [Vibrio sp. 04Ya108]BCN24789.1 hypothetical protein VYA_19810 [Vibrio alfacsensis]BCN27150.1 hypothetical protein VYA_43420 [Vibrio alfacsensis]
MMKMTNTKKHRINRDVYEALAPKELQSFTVNDVRNSLRNTSAEYSDPLSLRVFVAREVKKLVDAGVVIGLGNQRNRIYHKTPLFYEIDFYLTQRRYRKKKSGGAEKEAVIELLQYEKNNLERERSTIETEVEEYQLLIERSEELGVLLSPLLQTAQDKLSGIVTRLNVRTQAINLITEMKRESPTV